MSQILQQISGQSIKLDRIEGSNTINTYLKRGAAIEGPSNPNPKRPCILGPTPPPKML